MREPAEFVWVVTVNKYAHILSGHILSRQVQCSPRYVFTFCIYHICVIIRRYNQCISSRNIMRYQKTYLVFKSSPMNIAAAGVYIIDWSSIAGDRRS